MKDSIFAPSFGNRPRIMVGRDEELSYFKAALNSPAGSRDRAALILGQRGYGKTVMLLEMAEIARRNGFVVASPTIVSTDLQRRIIEKLYDDGSKYLHQDKRELSGGNVSVIGFGLGFQTDKSGGMEKSYEYRLIEVCRRLTEKGKGVLILVDEVQANSESLKSLIAVYQEMVGEGLNVAIVMAGLPGAVSTTLNEHVLTFLNRARKIDLGPLNERVISDYYRKVFKELGISLDVSKYDELAGFTEGSPYLMQLAGHYITIYSDDSGQIDKNMYEKALNDAKTDFITDICETTLNTLSDRDIEFLKSMTQDIETSRVSDIAERMEVSAAYAQRYKKRLIDSGVIKQIKRGEVCFCIAYLKDYLQDKDN